MHQQRKGAIQIIFLGRSNKLADRPNIAGCMGLLLKRRPMTRARFPMVKTTP
jgi:hypothetical protein